MSEKENDLLTLHGIVETIVYHNDDNDYTVMEIITDDGQLTTAVGKIAYVVGCFLADFDDTVPGAHARHLCGIFRFSLTRYVAVSHHHDPVCKIAHAKRRAAHV